MNKPLLTELLHSDEMDLPGDDEVIPVADEGEQHFRPAVQLPAVVHALNLVLFGDGRFCVIVVLFVGVKIVYCIRSAVEDYPSVVWMSVDIAAAVEIIVNAHFGWYYCSKLETITLVRLASEQHGVPEKESLRRLDEWSKVAVIFSMGVLVSWGLNSWITLTAVDVYVVLDAFGWAVAVLTICYLCALWAWTNWYFKRVGQNVVADYITTSHVFQGNASIVIFELLATMRSTSHVWGVNHGIRTVTSVVVAEAYLHMAIEQNSWTYYGFAVTGFIVVWVTAAAAGYVTTNFHGEVQRKVTEVFHANLLQCEDNLCGSGGCGGIGGSATVRGGSTAGDAAKDTPTALMQRVAICRNSTGRTAACQPYCLPSVIAFWLQGCTSQACP